MSDGYVGLFIIPDEGAQFAVLTSQGTIAVTELVDGPPILKRSKAKIAITGVNVASGAVVSVGIEFKKDVYPAINSLFFGGADGTVNPNDGDTVTVQARVYTFKTALTAIDQIKIGTTPQATALNFVKAINLTGVAGTNYFTGQTISAHVFAVVDGLNVTLRALIGGTAGNAYTLACTGSPRLTVDSATFAGGAVADATWMNGGSFPVANSSTGLSNWTGATNNDGNFIVEGLPVSAAGIPYIFRVRMYNADTQQAVNNAYPGIPQETVTSPVFFNGVNDIAEYTEVYDLACANASSTEGSPTTPSTLPPGGLARLTWSDMTKYSRLIAQTKADGTTADVDASQLAQLNEYVVFMYIATASVAPAVSYPSPTEANGTWYLIARTKNCYAEIQCPKNKKIAFWVGFGTLNTRQTTVTPIEKPLTLAQY
jgi:hypothetical protein